MESDRFARQRSLPEVGDEGQRRLRRARVLVVGLGGLGSPVAQLLAGAGVGTIGLCDFDTVDATNLQRQTLYGAADVGHPKVERAILRLQQVDSQLTFVPHVAKMDAGIAAQLLPHYDLVVSCTDDAAAAYVLNDQCARLGKPLVHAACSAWEGELTTVVPGGACLRCLRPSPRQGPTCAIEGVLGPVPATLGAMQAAEAIKWILGQPVMSGKLLLWDARGGTDLVTYGRRTACPAHMSEQGPACPLPWNAPKTADIAVHELAGRESDFFLLDVREQDEWEMGHLADATLVPLGQLAQRVVELPRDRPIVCICAVGGRSGRATEFLNQKGFQAVNLRGGMRAWHMAGLPLEY